MRRFFALAHASAMEALSEPLSCVLFFVAAMTVHLAPVFHYHQFGEPTRLPLECGLSALFVFGLVFASSAAFKTIGRELSSATASVALVRPLSRGLFFSAKLFWLAVVVKALVQHHLGHDDNDKYQYHLGNDQHPEDRYHGIL